MGIKEQCEIDAWQLSFKSENVIMTEKTQNVVSKKVICEENIQHWDNDQL
jgi:hypothetical protein